jgi:membrane fusion protein, multidrug efflux system
MRFLRQSMIGLFLAALTLGLMVYAVVLVGGAVQERLADDPKAPPARERVFAVNVQVAKAETITPILQSYGALQSRRLLELRAAGSGRVIALAEGFEEGGRVTAGQELVRLDPADAQSAVERAVNDLADAEAAVRDADRTLTLARDELAAADQQAVLRERAFERQRDLAERGVGTAIATETAELAASAAQQAVLSRRQAVAQAQTGVDQAATGLARSRIALAEAQRGLDDTVLIAPFTGNLSATSVVVGRLVSANERLAELIDPADLEVSFRLSTAQYARLLGDNGTLLRAEVSIILDVTGVDFLAHGKISRAAAAAGEGATGRLVFATLDRTALDGAAGFKPGDFVTVQVREPQLHDVVRLPASAVGAGNEVLVLGTQDRLEAVTVTVLRTQGDDVLLRGPIVGREVVEARSPLLGAGIAVKPLHRDGAEPAKPDTAEMLELTEEHRARLVAFVEGNNRMPQDAKARVLAQLSKPQVPAQMVARIESRMGG